MHFFYVTKYKNTSRRHVFKIHNRFKISSKESTFAEKYHPTIRSPKLSRSSLHKLLFLLYGVRYPTTDIYIYIYSKMNIFPEHPVSQ